MIELREVTKIYPRAKDPAVEGITLSAQEGEICVFIGPSGCGKTTLMRLINRLLRLTSGKILLGRRDIHDLDEIQLRRGIGYVIQQVGLFPNMTVRDNVAVVPRLLGWPEARIQKRVDELLALVNLQPDLYRHRYPRELSGGEAQRIGVLRALAADPPYMLMDEPFGAIDPINRATLQNEFLKLQERVRKTVIFVTHDLDEAIKMGDRICILRQGRLEQYGTPEEILRSPRSDFVKEFVGPDRALKRLQLFKTREAMIRDAGYCLPGDDPGRVRGLMREKGLRNLLVLDEAGVLLGYVREQDLAHCQGGTLAPWVRPMPSTVGPEANLRDALAAMLDHDLGILCVVGQEGVLMGVLDPSALLSFGAPPRSLGTRESWGPLARGGRLS